MNPSYRSKAADRYSMYLSPNLEHLVERVIAPDDYKRKDKLDRAIIVKVAHWDATVVERLSRLNKDNDTIKSQFTLIAVLISVEAAIGNPWFRNDSSLRFKSFFRNNLQPAEQRKLIDSFSFVTRKNRRKTLSLNKVVEQLIEMRNGLVHRAELPNLITDEKIDFVVTLSKGRGGRRRSVLDRSLDADSLVDLTRNAIKHYFSLHHSRRLPLQDFRIGRYKKRTPPKR